MLFSKNKIISLALFLAALGLSFYFWTLQKSIIINENIGRGLIIQSVIVFIVFLVLVALQLMVSKKLIGFLTALVLPITFVLVFRFIDSASLIVSGVALFLGVSAWIAAKKEQSHRLKLSIVSAKKGTSVYFFAGLLLLTALLYQSNFVKGQIKLSEGMINYFLPLIENQVKSQVPFYSPDMTTDQLVVISALSSSEITITQKDMSLELQKKIKEKTLGSPDPTKAMREALQLPEIQKLVIDDYVKNNPKIMAKLRDEYGKKFGVQIKENQGFVATLTEGINALINKTLDPFKNYLPIAFAISFFLGFKILGFIFVDVAIAIGGGIFFLLKSGGVLKINNNNVVQETLE